MFIIRSGRQILCDHPRLYSADLHATRYFRVFVEGKSSLASDRDLQRADSNGFVDTIDLQNAFADVRA
jgi:hypothetical protein